MAGLKDLFGQTVAVQAVSTALDGLIAIAFTDPLTKIPNRNALNEVINLSLGFIGQTFGAVMIDLTGFKRVNDEGGHAAGDAALGLVGETLLSMCDLSAHEPRGLPFRYGGDEFCILVPSDGFKKFVQTSNLSKLKWSGFTFQEKDLSFGASIGFANPDTKVGIGQTIERADVAAKFSKAHEDKPTRWSRKIANERIVSNRTKCSACSATLTISINSTKYNPNVFKLCPNCGGAIVGSLA